MVAIPISQCRQQGDLSNTVPFKKLSLNYVDFHEQIGGYTPLSNKCSKTVNLVAGESVEATTFNRKW